MRRLLSLLILAVGMATAVYGETALPATSPAPLPGYNDRTVVQKRIAASGPHRIEGIWRFPETGSTVAIEREDNNRAHPGAVTYRMIVMRSDNRSIRPGTFMGIITPSVKSDVFDASIYTSSHRNSSLDSPRRFTLTLAEKGDRLVFSRVKSKFSLNLWRILPYMFRYAVRRNNNTGEAPEGCVKIFPAPAVPAEPRYL